MEGVGKIARNGAGKWSISKINYIHHHSVKDILYTVLPDTPASISSYITVRTPSLSALIKDILYTLISAKSVLANTNQLRQFCQFNWRKVSIVIICKKV